MSIEPAQDLCKASFVAAVKDATNVVSGKWKLPIVCALLRADYRFAELERLLQTATPRVLSRELKELELNGVLARRPVVQAGKPVVLYALTESGRALEAVIIGMAQWGQLHRRISRGTDGPLA